MAILTTVGRILLLAWEVSAVREEPWRWLLQDLSYARCEEEYVVCLEASDPERALGELAASEAPCDSGYGGAMRELFGFDLARAGSSELLFTWRDDLSRGERWALKNS